MEEQKTSDHLKLYMLLLGAKPIGRNVEQHDYFFGIATTLKDLVPGIKASWPEGGSGLHVDAWREVNIVNGYKIRILPKDHAKETSLKKLFFINLGGYRAQQFEEKHYVVLTVQDELSLAIRDAKKTTFFSINTMKGANSHVDDQYGIDVDEAYPVGDLLSPAQKASYTIDITPSAELADDEIHVGYFKLDKLP